MSELLRDLRFGMRLLAKNPVFATTAVLLLAVGISANTLIFSVVNAVLLRPLPVAHPENLVRLVEIRTILLRGSSLTACAMPWPREKQVCPT